MTGDAFAPEVEEDGDTDDVQGIININFLRELQYEDAVLEEGDAREDGVIIVAVHVRGRCKAYGCILEGDRGLNEQVEGDKGLIGDTGD